MKFFIRVDRIIEGEKKTSFLTSCVLSLCYSYSEQGFVCCSDYVVYLSIMQVCYWFDFCRKFYNHCSFVVCWLGTKVFNLIIPIHKWTFGAYGFGRVSCFLVVVFPSFHFSMAVMLFCFFSSGTSICSNKGTEKHPKITSSTGCYTHRSSKTSR